MGRREWIALAAVAAAAIIAIPVALRANDSGGPATGPTPLPNAGPLGPPNAWIVTFARIVDGRIDADEPVAFPDLDLAFAGAPFGEYADGQWLVTAEGTWASLAPGRYTLTLEYDAALVVRAGDRLLAEEKDPGEDRTIELKLEHQGGDLVIAIEARDGPGPFLLHFVRGQ